MRCVSVDMRVDAVGCWAVRYGAEWGRMVQSGAGSAQWCWTLRLCSMFVVS